MTTKAVTSMVAGAHQATLSWVDPTPGATFNIYRSATPGGENYGAPLATGVTGSPWVDIGPFVDGQVCYYTVEAIVGGLSSGPSNEAVATFPTPPTPPSSLTVVTT